MERNKWSIDSVENIVVFIWLNKMQLLQLAGNVCEKPGGRKRSQSENKFLIAKQLKKENRRIKERKRRGMRAWGNRKLKNNEGQDAKTLYTCWWSGFGTLFWGKEQILNLEITKSGSRGNSNPQVFNSLLWSHSSFKEQNEVYNYTSGPESKNYQKNSHKLMTLA